MQAASLLAPEILLKDPAGQGKKIDDGEQYPPDLQISLKGEGLVAGNLQWYPASQGSQKRRPPPLQ